MLSPTSCARTNRVSRSHRQAKLNLGVLLLLAPFGLWLLLLIILPHSNLFLISLSQKSGPGQHTLGLSNYADFFSEPLYWNTFLRTAIMSISATVLTLLVIPLGCVSASHSLREIAAARDTQAAAA